MNTLLSFNSSIQTSCYDTTTKMITFVANNQTRHYVHWNWKSQSSRLLSIKVDV